ncbi:hypothetical protein V1525DRAFT_272789 [Lipomyces kononenkoae]|uniref:Uncharacterized protein n=1 Tax=Lipomyces kononenkoae TaxID=34357 RepID=A0ACC3SV82_LIPKO
MFPVVRKSNIIKTLVLYAAVLSVFVFISAKSAKVLTTSTRDKQLSGTVAGARTARPAETDGNLRTVDTPVPQPVIDNEIPVVNGKSLNLEFLIPLTSSHFNFCRSLYTALINDYPTPTLINWGKDSSDPRQSHLMKITGIDEYLHRMRLDQYALIMDGDDVWYQLPYRDFVSHFLELTEPMGYDIAVFGADKKCWPNEPLSPACANIPESTLPINSYGPWTDGRMPILNPSLVFTYNRPRWLNSGSAIGPVSILREIYHRANEAIQKVPADSVLADQKYIADVYGQRDLNMTVDHKSVLFQTMTFSDGDIMFVHNDIFQYPRKVPSGRRMLALNKVSATVPPVLHFNGPKKTMDTWWPQMWWSRERNNQDVIDKSRVVFETGGAYTVDGQFLSWNDLCGDANIHSPPPWKPENL